MTAAESHLAIRPDLAAPLEAYRSALLDGALDLELLDRCSRLVQCRIDGESIPGVDEADDARASAVLAFADQFVLDPHGIDDDLRDRVLDHLSTRELAVLVQWLAVSDGVARFGAVVAATLDPEAP